MAIVAAGIIVALITLIGVSIPTYFVQFIGEALYGIGKLILDLADFMQMIFRRLAGLDVYWYKDGVTGVYENAQEGDILLKLFTTDVVIEAIISMTLFAVALLLIVTIVQIIRVEYTTEGSKNSKGTIIGKALKSLAMFILIPVVCFLGVFASNKLLAAVDAATTQSGATSLSGYVFVAAAADANVIRQADASRDNIEKLGGTFFGIGASNGEKQKAVMSGGGVKGWKTSFFGSNKSSEDAKRADIANDIDQAFVSVFSKHTAEKNTAITIAEAKDNTVEFKQLKDDRVLHYSYTNAVQYFYDLWDINYLILYFGGFMTLMALFRASFGLVLRLYKATALFIISPGVTALTPIDDGNAYKQWRKAFISNVLGAYGFVIAMNLLFLLLGIIDNIYLFDPNRWTSAAPNALVRAVMVIVGVNMLEDLSKQISGFIGGADILSEGKSASEKAGKTIGKIGSAVGAGVMMAGGLAGGIAAKIYAGKANKAKATGRYSRHSDNLKRLKEKDPDSLTDEEKAEMAKEEQWLSKHQDQSAEGRAQIYRQRAAAGARAQIRGREVRKNTWEGSALGSFLNTATGGYIEAFGGKQIKNIDEKNEEKNQVIYDLAGKNDNDLWTIGGALNWLNSQPGNLMDSRGAVNKSQAQFEKRKVANEAINQTGEQYMSGVTYDDNRIRYMNNKEIVEGNEEAVANTKTMLSGLQAKIGSEQNMDWNFISKLKEQFMKLNSDGMDKDSKDLFEQYKQAISESVDGDTAVAELIKKLNIDNLKADHTVFNTKGEGLSWEEFLKTDDGLDGKVKDDMYQAVRSHSERVNNNGVKEVDNTLKAMTAYDEYIKQHPERAPGYKPPKPDEKGNGGQGGGENKNITINNADVKMDNSKVDMKSSETKLNDGNQIANKVATTVGEAMKQIKEKKDKDVKENRTYEMLEKIQKILKNVEKNTKKK